MFCLMLKVERREGALTFSRCMLIVRCNSLEPYLVITLKYSPLKTAKRATSWAKKRDCFFLDGKEKEEVNL